MVSFKGNNKMGVIGKRFIVVINYVKTIQINIFTSVVEDNELCLANVDRHLVRPKPGYQYLALSVSADVGAIV